MEPYRDTPTSPSSHDSRLSSDGHLSKAYAIQQVAGPLLNDEGNEGPQPEHVISNTSESTTSESPATPTIPLRCPTVAPFDYMCQNRIDPHSWASYLLIPITSGMYNTVFLVLIFVLIYENKKF